MEQESTKTKYTAAFIGITLSGEIFIIDQHKGNDLIDCARWRARNRIKFEKLYGDVREITIQHKNR